MPDDVYRQLEEAEINYRDAAASGARARMTLARVTQERDKALELLRATYPGEGATVADSALQAAAYAFLVGFPKKAEG